eukprot:9503958-Pyramimonas_sp.AAC.2
MKYYYSQQLVDVALSTRRCRLIDRSIQGSAPRTRPPLASTGASDWSVVRIYPRFLRLLGL